MNLRKVAGHALLVEMGSQIDEATHEAVLALDRALQETPPPGLVEVVPAFVNLLLVFDPALTSHEALSKAVRALPPRPQALAPRRHDLAITYDGRDLPEVARKTGLTEAEVAACHAQGDYKVFLYGFAPGYAYLGGLPAALRLDRKPQPLRDVPAGSVIIAGSQCLVTTLTMPTGWWIIGHSPARILTGDPARPFLFEVGDRVRFQP